MAIFGQSKMSYKKVGHDRKKREYGNLINEGRIVAMAVAKNKADVIIKRFNAFTKKGAFK